MQHDMKMTLTFFGLMVGLVLIGLIMAIADLLSVSGWLVLLVLVLIYPAWRLICFVGEIVILSIAYFFGWRS